VFIGTWVDGFVVAGQRPGRVGKLRKLPVLDRKPVAAFVTYAINPGKALDKTARILQGRGAEVIAKHQFRRDHIERDVPMFVSEVLNAVAAPA
jgi:hypothetical protein